MASARKRFASAPDSRKIAHMAEAFFTLYQDAPLWERQARAYAYALVREPVVIDPDDRIIGMIHRKGALAGDPFCGYGASDEFGEWNAQWCTQRRIEQELPELLPYVQSTPDSPSATFLLSSDFSPGHIAWRWDRVPRDGLNAILQQHRRAAECATDAKAAAYYRGVVICLDAILEWNQRHIKALRSMMSDTSLAPEQIEGLRQSAAVLERVPAQPARNFREALQSYHFLWLCAFYDGPYGGNSPGRFDYLMWPFLEPEFRSGAITHEQAVEWVAEVFIRCEEVVFEQDTSVLTLVTGGLTPDGVDATNPLTHIVLDAIEPLPFTHPAVYNRIGSRSPEDYRHRCYRYMLQGANRAQFLNEDAILRAMACDGRMPTADAAMYICGGCMELNPQGLTSDLFWAFRYNICKTLELCMSGGIDLLDGRQRLPARPSLADFADFESFYRYFESEIEKLLVLKFKALDIAAAEMARLRPQFVISSMVDDCFARGRNQMDGGARYADYGGSVIGMPNVANSLTAIKIAIFDEAFLDAAELLQTLRTNFEGREAVRLRLRQLPKYGEGHPEADEIMQRLLESVSRVFDGYTTRHGGRCKQVLLTFLFAPSLGAALGATPEGNRAGTPVAHGLTPINAKGSLSDALQSYLSLDNTQVTGGASTMWDLDPDWVNADVLDAIYQVFEQGGGQIFQGNMTDVAELEKAFAHPESYPNLLVRVGGFSAHFTRLNRAVQQEIIARRRWK